MILKFSCPLQYSAWKIPWTEEPGGLQSMGSPRVGHDWATSLSLFTFMHWRRKWQPTPVFLPGESQGWGSLVGCRLWGRTELDTTERLHFPVFWPGKFHRQGSWVGNSSWGHKRIRYNLATKPPPPFLLTELPLLPFVNIDEWRIHFIFRPK